MDLAGLEPATSCMPCKRAPGCATGPFLPSRSRESNTALPVHSRASSLKDLIGQSLQIVLYPAFLAIWSERQAVAPIYWAEGTISQSHAELHRRWIVTESLSQLAQNIQLAPKPPIPGLRSTPRGIDSGPSITAWQVRDKALLRLIAATEDVSATAGISMNVVGMLGGLPIPTGNLGTELAAAEGTLTALVGRRRVPGTVGQTIVELEKNGQLTGYQLAWTPADGAFALDITEMKLNVKLGDRLSLRILSVEAGAEDLFCLAVA